jgi:hypothetical protein
MTSREHQRSLLLGLALGAVLSIVALFPTEPYRAVLVAGAIIAPLDRAAGENPSRRRW